jgi:N-acetylglucosamine malate deacetylase 1
LRGRRAFQLQQMKLIPRSLLRIFSRVARPYLSAYGLLQTSKVFNRSALVWAPEDERVAVIAPHMDDETIGCGGTLARHVARGAEVSVIFLTDGSRGGVIPPDREKGPAGTQRTLAEVRKEEARAALAELGVTDLIFLDAIDSQVMQTPGLGARLAEHLKAIRPDVVYLPFFLEEHPDHRAASQVLLDAVQGSAVQFRCHGYEVWTPLFPNCLVNIDQTVEIKRKAIAHYRSQLAETDYSHAALGINAYRSSAFLGNCQYAEAFCALPLAHYLELFTSYRRASRH